MIEFILGVFVGTVIGFITAAILSVASKTDMGMEILNEKRKKDNTQVTVMAISNITSLSIMDDNIKRTFIILERTNMDIITIISVGNALGMYKIKLSINSL